MMLRTYQRESLDALYNWWMRHPKIDDCGIICAPTGSGKSVVIAELTRLLFDTWPDAHPRTLIVVPSKELAEQNAEKLCTLLPAHLRIGYYSASLGKTPTADVIVATIGSVYKAAHVIGNIKMVIVDECHLINPNGAEVGRYRQFLTGLASYCAYRVVGLTATPFRGNGVWLTDGDAPMFTGIAHTTKIQSLLEAGFLAPLIRPIDALQTRIDTTGIGTSSGDYNLEQLSERVENYLEQVVAETLIHAADRKKWLAFTPTVENADRLAALLRHRGIAVAVVCGATPKREREQLIAQFRAGELRCLVTVLALATGFDVPDVDCIIWARPTQSPVLYVQGAGRGMRIAPGKADCLWLDYSDTTERLGPVDSVKGRKKRKQQDRAAPTKVCDACGERCPTKCLECPSCGFVFPAEEPEKVARSASNAAIMAAQIAPKINTYPVTDVRYSINKKPGSPDSLRVDYWSGLRKVASEWVAFESANPWAREKAIRWLHRRGLTDLPRTTAAALDRMQDAIEPSTITVNESGRWPEIIKVEFTREEEATP